MAQAPSNAIDLASGLMSYMSLEPVTVVLDWDHPFKLKKGTKHVCEVCEKGRMMPEHGIFSTRNWGSGGNRFVYQEINKAWRKVWVSLLRGTDLPTPCSHIEVMGRVSFPDRTKRDEDNHRYGISKFLGDALQDGGYLLNDDWASYRFRELDLMPATPGLQRVELTLMWS